MASVAINGGILKRVIIIAESILQTTAVAMDTANANGMLGTSL